MLTERRRGRGRAARRPSWWWTTAPPTCRCWSARCTAAVTASWSRSDGATALEIARRATPDLVLLDVMMPEMDGFEVCRRLKAQPETRDAAVIFLSARGEVSDKVSGLELGAVDYITKPIQAEEVLARVATHLSRQHLERALRDSRDRLDRELAGAARMQRLILPRRHAGASGRRVSPRTTRPAVMPAATTTTCSPLGADRFGIMVADVSGHGAPAAIVMAMIRAVLHTYPGAARRSAGGAASHQPAFPVSLGDRDVCDRGLRRARCRAAARSACRRPAIRRRCCCGRAARRCRCRSTRPRACSGMNSATCRASSMRSAAGRSAGVLHRRHHRSAGARRLDVRPGAVLGRTDAHRRQRPDRHRPADRRRARSLCRRARAGRRSDAASSPASTDIPSRDICPRDVQRSWRRAMVAATSAAAFSLAAAMNCW